MLITNKPFFSNKKKKKKNEEAKYLSYFLKCKLLRLNKNEVLSFG